MLYVLCIHSPSEVLIKHDPHLIQIIETMSDPDNIVARAAINELNEIVESPNKQAVLLDYEEIFIENVLKQLKVYFNTFITLLC